jgi:hypothetical protein
VDGLKKGIQMRYSRAILAAFSISVLQPSCAFGETPGRANHGDDAKDLSSSTEKKTCDYSLGAARLQSCYLFSTNVAGIATPDVLGLGRLKKEKQGVSDDVVNLLQSQQGLGISTTNSQSGRPSVEGELRYQINQSLRNSRVVSYFSFLDINSKPAPPPVKPPAEQKPPTSDWGQFGFGASGTYMTDQDASQSGMSDDKNESSKSAPSWHTLTGKIGTLANDYYAHNINYWAASVSYSHFFPLFTGDHLTYLSFTLADQYQHRRSKWIPTVQNGGLSTGVYDFPSSYRVGRVDLNSRLSDDIFSLHADVRSVTDSGGLFKEWTIGWNLKNFLPITVKFGRSGGASDPLGNFGVVGTPSHWTWDLKIQVNGS